jgi:Predicted phosphoadenosine phosphosulfate sulfotransferase
MIKIPLSQTVEQASIERISWVLNTFSRICVSFSGGKDSSVMLHITARLARQMGKKISILFIDWEAQFDYTIRLCEELRQLYRDVTNDFYWVALPLTTQNGLSQFQPEWQCWAPGVQWVRQPPDHAITDPSFFPFYQHAMTFETFVIDFAEWFSQRQPAAMLIGIRADESLNRFMTITSRRKTRFSDDKPWTTAAAGGHTWQVYPIYDWKVADIWTWFSRTNLPYNSLYNLMYQAGVPLRQMRICEPFGPEQRQGLWLYHVLEPHRWAAMCQRVSGVESGGLYTSHKNAFYGFRTLTKPDGLTWQDYAILLLDSMPPDTATHYRNKIAVYLHWYQKKGIDNIQDEQSGDLGTRDVPSWRRICKALLRNDYWCRLLSFSPTKAANFQRYTQRMINRRKEWGILCNND